MQFGFMPERGTIYAVFILRRMQVVYHAKGEKLYMSFDRVQGKVLEWALRKKGIPDVLLISVMSSHEGAKT